jgi:hypothetical protein
VKLGEPLSQGGSGGKPQTAPGIPHPLTDQELQPPPLAVPVLEGLMQVELESSELVEDDGAPAPDLHLGVLGKLCGRAERRNALRGQFVEISATQDELFYIVNDRLCNYESSRAYPYGGPHVLHMDIVLRRDLQECGVLP